MRSPPLCRIRTTDIGGLMGQTDMLLLWVRREKAVAGEVLPVSKENPNGRWIWKGQ